jgi:hypothetical protein
MSLYEEYNKSKKETATGSLYSEFTKSKEPKTSTFSKIKTFGTEMAKDIARPFARVGTSVAQTGQALSKLPEVLRTGKTTINPVQPFSGKTLGNITPVGIQTYDKGGIDIKNPLPGLKNSAKDLIDIGGVGAELTSYLVGAGQLKSGYTVGKATVAGAKEVAKQSLKGMAVEGVTAGLLQSTGQQVQKYAQDGTPISVKDIGYNTAAGGVLGPVLGLVGRGVGKIFNRGEKSAALAVADEVIPDKSMVENLSETAGNSLQRSQDGIREKSLNFYRENPNEITKPPVRLREVDGKVVIEDGRHRLEAAREAGIKDLQIEDVTPQYPAVESQLAPQSDVISSIIRNGKKAPELAQQAIEEGTTFIPKLASDVESVAIEKGLVSKFEGLPEAQTMNMKKQADDALNLVNNDYEFAKRVAMGAENAPGDLRDASVFEAVKLRAVKEGDVATLKKLATESTVPARVSAYAQQVKAADARLLDSTDPVELMQTVIKAREKGVQLKQKAVKKADTAQVKQIIKKAPKRQDWDAFITSIEC